MTLSLGAVCVPVMGCHAGKKHNFLKKTIQFRRSVTHYEEWTAVVWVLVA